jgi:hypothetical protein
MNILSEIPFFWEKKPKKKKHHNCLQYEKVLKDFLLSNFEYFQIYIYRKLQLEQHHKIEKIIVVLMRFFI